MSSSASSPPENRQELANLVNQQATQIEQLEAKVRWFEEQSCTACGGPMHEMSEELRPEVKLIPQRR